MEKSLILIVNFFFFLLLVVMFQLLGPSIPYLCDSRHSPVSSHSSRPTYKFLLKDLPHPKLDPEFFTRIPSISLLFFQKVRFSYLSQEHM